MPTSLTILYGAAVIVIVIFFAVIAFYRPKK